MFNVKVFISYHSLISEKHKFALLLTAFQVKRAVSSAKDNPHEKGF